MKNKKIAQLAILGLTHGLLMSATVEADVQTTSSNAQEARYAKAGCPGGCGGKKSTSSELQNEVKDL